MLFLGWLTFAFGGALLAFYIAFLLAWVAQRGGLEAAPLALAAAWCAAIAWLAFSVWLSGISISVAP